MSERSDTVGIVGAGAFGTALAARVATAGRRSLVWSTTPAVVDEINERHTNGERLEDVRLPAEVSATTSPEELAERARFIVFAVGSTEVRGRARTLGAFLDGSHLLVHAIAALEDADDRRVSDVLREETPAIRVGALAGPALPNELARRQFASMVVASEFDEVAAEGRRLLGVPPGLRVYQGSDLIGVELAAALSGAHTVALGIADALDVGGGPRAVMITRAVAEASRLGEAAGADPRTFSGLAGLGNLLVRSSTETRHQSRDYRTGLAIARGEQPAVIRAEGVRAATAAVRLAARLKCRRPPILHAVDLVARGELDPAKAAGAIAESVAAEEF